MKLLERIINKLGWVILLLLVFSGCNQQVVETQIEPPISTTIIPAITTPTIEEVTPTFTTEPTSEPPTPTPIPDPVCYQEIFPAGYETSSAVTGMKMFASENDLVMRPIYFSPACTLEEIEQDIKLLFYGDVIQDNEIALMLLEPMWEGTLGNLYNHLAWYEFWAMGPEDYPLIFESTEGIETNIIIFRVDKMNGDGHEGNALLGLMQGMAEHEYIHTVQGRNNPNLAEMIWNQGVYRAYIERYANLGNNTGQRYYRSSYTMLLLLQFLDDLNTQGALDERLGDILIQRGSDLGSFSDRDLASYHKHLSKQLREVSGDMYLERLATPTGKISPLDLVNMAGCGDLLAFEVVRQLYDENVADYNLRFYGTNKEQYLPTRFDILFDPN